MSGYAGINQIWPGSVVAVTDGGESLRKERMSVDWHISFIKYHLKQRHFLSNYKVLFIESQCAALKISWGASLYAQCSVLSTNAMKGFLIAGRSNVNVLTASCTLTTVTVTGVLHSRMLLATPPHQLHPYPLSHLCHPL